MFNLNNHPVFYNIVILYKFVTASLNYLYRRYCDIYQKVYEKMSKSSTQMSIKI